VNQVEQEGYILLQLFPINLFSFSVNLRLFDIIQSEVKTRKAIISDGLSCFTLYKIIPF